MTQGSDINEKIFRLFRYAQVGQCVNSVSHDINNLLGVILAYAELVSVDPSLSPESHRMVVEIVNAVRKAGVLVSTLNDVARKEKTDVRIIEPTQLAERALSLVQYTIRTQNVVLEKQFKQPLGNLAVDLPRMVMALVYLLINAFEAAQMAAEKRMRFCVEEDGKGVRFTIWNAGEPPDECVQQEMFSPFFSTKGGSHLGLGLSFAREIVHEHDGELIFNRDQGFVLRLPYCNRYIRSDEKTPKNLS